MKVGSLPGKVPLGILGAVAAAVLVGAPHLEPRRGVMDCPRGVRNVRNALRDTVLYSALVLLALGSGLYWEKGGQE